MFLGMQDFDFAQILPVFAQILAELSKFYPNLPKSTQIVPKFAEIFPKKFARECDHIPGPAPTALYHLIPPLLF